MNTPAQVYLALASEGSHAATKSALLLISELVTGQRHLDALDWATVDYLDAQRLRTSLCAKFSSSTTNKTLSTWRGLVREAWRLGLISNEQRERLAGIPSVRQTRAQTGRLVDDASLIRLFAAIPRVHWSRRHAYDPVIRNTAMLGLAVGCGLRRSELFSLEASGYNPQAGTIVVNGKGSKRRLAHVSGATKAHLDAWLLSSGITSGPVFPSPTGKALTSQVFLTVLSRAACEAGIGTVRPHDLRRTFATKMLLSGLDVLQVQQLMGHASPVTTAVYDHRPAAVLHAAATGLEMIPCED